MAHAIVAANRVRQVVQAEWLQRLGVQVVVALRLRELRRLDDGAHAGLPQCALVVLVLDDPRALHLPGDDRLDVGGAVKPAGRTPAGGRLVPRAGVTRIATVRAVNVDLGDQRAVDLALQLVLTIECEHRQLVALEGGEHGPMSQSLLESHGRRDDGLALERAQARLDARLHLLGVVHASSRGLKDALALDIQQSKAMDLLLVRLQVVGDLLVGAQLLQLLLQRLELEVLLDEPTLVASLVVGEVLQRRLALVDDLLLGPQQVERLRALVLLLADLRLRLVLGGAGLVALLVLELERLLQRNVLGLLGVQVALALLLVLPTSLHLGRRLIDLAPGYALLEHLDLLLRLESLLLGAHLALHALHLGQQRFGLLLRPGGRFALLPQRHGVVVHLHVIGVQLGVGGLLRLGQQAGRVQLGELADAELGEVDAQVVDLDVQPRHLRLDVLLDDGLDALLGGAHVKLRLRLVLLVERPTHDQIVTAVARASEEFDLDHARIGRGLDVLRQLLEAADALRLTGQGDADRAHHGRLTWRRGPKRDRQRREKRGDQHTIHTSFAAFSIRVALGPPV